MSAFDEDIAVHPLQVGRSLETSEPTGQSNPPNPEVIASDQDGDAPNLDRVMPQGGPATRAEAEAAETACLLHGAPRTPTPLVVEGISEEVELILVHATPPKPPTQEDMQLPTRKLYVRTSERLLATLEPLRHLTGKRSAQFTLLDEDVPLEAVGAALEWLSVGNAAEREALLGSLPDWHALLGVLAAASWLGLPTLREACEALLRPEVCLEHVLALAIAAEKCDALLLLSDCFYLLRAFFCATDVEALFPRERAFCSGGPAPVLLPDAVLQGALRIEHGAWAPVHSACLCREAHLRVPQPHYTLCQLQRERYADRPSIYRLISEHDGRPLLVAQQSGPGGGQLLTTYY